MNHATPFRIALATLAILAIGAVPAAAADDNVPEILKQGDCPADPPQTIWGTPYVIAPSDGYYWDEDDVKFAGDSYNASVRSRTYDVGDYCVAGADVYYVEQAGNACPPAGREPATTWVGSSYRTTGTYWKDGHLWLGGYWQNHYAGGQNNEFGDRCFGTAYTQTNETRKDFCLTCLDSDGGSDAILPPFVLP